MGQLLAETQSCTMALLLGRLTRRSVWKHTFLSASFHFFELMSVCPVATAALHRLHAVLSLHWPALSTALLSCLQGRSDSFPVPALLSSPSATVHLIQSLLWCNPLKVKVLTVPGCQFVPEFWRVSGKLFFFLVFGDVHELEEPSSGNVYWRCGKLMLGCCHTFWSTPW